ncbi:MAG: hypothetical protein WCL39_03280 [Armatimonadota bacterium]
MMKALVAVSMVCLMGLSAAFAEPEVELYRFKWDTTGDTDGWGTRHMMGGTPSGWILQVDSTSVGWDQDPNDLALPVGMERYINLDGLDIGSLVWPYGASPGYFPQQGGSLNLLVDNLVYEGWVGDALGSFTPATWWNRKTLKQWLVDNKGVSPNAIITKIQFNVTAAPRPVVYIGLMNVDFWFGGLDSGVVTGSRLRKTNLDAWGSVASYNPIKWTRTTYQPSDIRTGLLMTGSATVQAELGDLNGLVGMTFSNVRVFGVIVPPVTTAAVARTAPSGSAVNISQAIVSESFTSVPSLPVQCLYIQDAVDSGAGVRITGLPGEFASILPGARLQNIKGTIAWINGEAEIRASQWSFVSNGAVPDPYNMTNKAFVGAAGLAPRGIRNRTFGRVMSVDQAKKYVLIDDGSGVTQALGDDPILNGSFDSYPKPSEHWYAPDEWKTVTFTDTTKNWYQCNWGYINPPADPTDSNNAIWGLIPHGGRGWIYKSNSNPANDAPSGARQVITGLVAGQTYGVEAHGVALHNGTGQAKVRIGVDPSGGTQADAGTVIWGGYIVSPVGWSQTSVQFVATGGTATIYLEMNQMDAIKSTVPGVDALTATGFDDVRLVRNIPIGMKIYCDFGASWPAINSYITATGVAGAELVGSSTNPVVWAKPAGVTINQ